MNIMELIDLLEEEISASPKVPFSNKLKIDDERIYEILDELRRVIPEEVRKAEMIRKEKQSIIHDANKEAEVIIQDAQRMAKEMLDQNEITKLAIEKGNEIVANAQKNAKEIRYGAKAYAEDVLNDMENYMKDYIANVRKNREALAGKQHDAE